MARSIFCIMSSMLMISSLLIVASAYESGFKPNPEPEEEDKKFLLDSKYLQHQSQELEPVDQVIPEGYSGYYPNNDISSIGVRGFILCKQGQKSFPLVGAVAKIVCLLDDDSAPYYGESAKTDDSGFFFASFVPSGAIGHNNLISKLKECKVFIENSPLKTCNVPTDVNNGKSGASLTTFTFLLKKFMRLYTVGPFFFAPNPSDEAHY